jgi:hypothetical protein
MIGPGQGDGAERAEGVRPLIRSPVSLDLIADCTGEHGLRVTAKAPVLG